MVLWRVLPIRVDEDVDIRQLLAAKAAAQLRNLLFEPQRQDQDKVASPLFDKEWD